MVLKINFALLVVTLSLVKLTSCVELDLIDCGIDHEVEVTVDDVAINQYPWIGVLYYIYHGDSGETRAVTTVILIQKEFVIANAADIGPMPKHNFRKNSFVLLGERWPERGRRVRNYVLHPEYGETYNTLALVQLKDIVRDIKPLCPAPELLRNPVFYVMKFHEDYNVLQKQVIPVAHIPSGMCKEFYTRANLYSKKMRPPHVACAVALDLDQPCVWNAGAALVSRDVWGRWQLLGVGTRGPGCGAPARFLDMTSYAPWVRSSLDKFQRITISKISKQKFVLRSSAINGGGGDHGGVYQRFGNCDPEEKKSCIYRELIHLHTDNMQYQFLTYNMTIRQDVEYSCLTMELVNGSSSSEMRIIHTCPRDYVNRAPCYYYKGSVFYISVYIIFSEGCIFEMYAWGKIKDMRLIDMQEWKWEEGTYYEDFSTQRHEYKGQKYMTDYGFEPLDQKMWVPDYDMWTTTYFGQEEETTTEVPGRFSIELANNTRPPFVREESTPSTTTIPTTTKPRTKVTLRRRTKFRSNISTTTPIIPTTTAESYYDMAVRYMGDAQKQAQKVQEQVSDWLYGIERTTTVRP